jgi:hypothetical protein
LPFGEVSNSVADQLGPTVVDFGQDPDVSDGV